VTERHTTKQDSSPESDGRNRRGGPSVATITAVGTVILAIITALVGGSIQILDRLEKTRTLVVAGQVEAKATGEVRDTKIQEIHLLVNSRLLTVLRLLVAVTKKEAERTGNREDISAYQEALSELQKAEAGAGAVALAQSGDLEKQKAEAAAAVALAERMRKEAAPQLATPRP
jgi:hypothetical protein